MGTAKCEYVRVSVCVCACIKNKYYILSVVEYVRHKFEGQVDKQ